MIPAWWSAWAKTDHDRQAGKPVEHWLPLHQHLADSAAVAARLVDEWVSPQVVRRVAGSLGGSESDVRTVATWLAATHDVGKLSPAFAVQAITSNAPRLADVMGEHGLRVSLGLATDRDRSRIRHEVVGQLAVKRWLGDELGFSPEVAAQFGSVVGAHHGDPPSAEVQVLAVQRPELSGTRPWVRARHDVLSWATDLVGGPQALRPFAERPLGRPAQVLLSAVVIVADWIASNDLFFSLDPLRTADDLPTGPDPERTARRHAAGWAEIDLPSRWRAAPVHDVEGAFTARFRRTARPVQVATMQAAVAQPEAGLIVVEAPMGEGKTEAALAAAEVLAARSGADGCYIALPTRATSDAMFSRVLSWMRALPDIEADTGVQLVHGTASLNEEFRGLLRAGRIRNVGQDGERDPQQLAGQAHQWFNGRNRPLLAPFVVGTIDQVLFGGLKTRHLALRHLGLAGKIVIIDEVHAYDVYMARYLDRVLHWLGAYGTPVVLLSATLPAQRRAELMAAYDSGRGAKPTPQPDSPGYPVVLASGLAARTVPASGTPRPVTLERGADDLDELVTLLRPALDDGGCVVVIRNTVTRVQETADRLISEFGDERVTVSHSRFLACDRARLDADLLARFGPPDAVTERPFGHVVVASQVVEQSLDVDFDLMVTDLAPVDLVLQRVGRLHRHQRGRPAAVARPRCVVVGVEDWAATPATAVRGSRAVYGAYPLLRSAALLLDRDTITLPDDIAPLVQAAYGPEPLVPASWRPVVDDARAADERKAQKRREEADHFRLDDIGEPDNTLDGWVRAGAGDADEDRRGSGRVRDGDESLEVLVVQRDRDGGLLTPDWIATGAAVQIPLIGEIDWSLARTIAACALRLPPALSRFDEVGDGVIRALERHRYESFRHPLLRDQLVLVLDGDRTAVIDDGAARVRLTYDPRRGLSHAPLP